jgi:AcrR family transcriptional regulator
MKTDESTLAPRQDRSRATVERLLNATIQLLDEAGLEGAVIPRIAVAAGMAPANVYRRFADKNALLRAAFLHALVQGNEVNRHVLGKQLRGDTLAEAASNLVALLIDQYRQHPHFLRALSRFIEGDSDQAFVQQARALIGENVDLVVAVLLAHRNDIRHAAAEPALRFAVRNASCSIEAYALDPQSIWHVEPSISLDD